MVTTTDDDDVAAAIDAAGALGPLAVLVNVAGGGVGGGRTVGRDGTPHDMEAFVKTMEMNATGTFNVTRLVARPWAANEPDEDGQRGVVVNTASIAGMEGQSGQVAYGAAKAAILGMTLPMARDLAPMGIRVCAIAPGTMGTPVMLGALPAPQEGPDRGTSSSPSGWAIPRNSPSWSSRSSAIRTSTARTSDSTVPSDSISTRCNIN